MELDWEEAKAYFDKVHNRYIELSGGLHANTYAALALVFAPLLKRYEDGERTELLYHSMMGVE